MVRGLLCNLRFHQLELATWSTARQIRRAPRVLDYVAALPLLQKLSCEVAEPRPWVVLGLSEAECEAPGALARVRARFHAVARIVPLRLLLGASCVASNVREIRGSVLVLEKVGLSSCGAAATHFKVGLSSQLKCLLAGTSRPRTESA